MRRAKIRSCPKITFELVDTNHKEKGFVGHHLISRNRRVEDSLRSPNDGTRTSLGMDAQLFGLQVYRVLEDRPILGAAAAGWFKWLYRASLEYFGPETVVTHHVRGHEETAPDVTALGCQQEFPAIPISSCRGSAIRK